MESDDLWVPLGLSSMNLTCDRIGQGISNQYKEWNLFESIMDDFCVFNP